MVRKKTFILWTSVRTWVPVLIVLIGLTGCTISRSPVTGERVFYGYTWEEEQQLGAQADGQIVAQYGVYTDGDIDEYVNNIGEKVLQYSHLRGETVDPQYRNLEFTFRVLDSPVVNAFALPGGYIYVTRGLMAYLQNEAQLAVVLGHEIGHGGAILGQEVFDIPAQDILDIGGTAVQLLFLSYSREHERESDRLGVEYAAKAGYVAEEGSDFFWVLRQLGEQSGQNLPTFLSTHPDPGNREVAIRDLAQKWSPSTEQTVINQDDFLESIRNVVFSDDPRQGFVENGTFYHPDMEFQFPVPDGWRVQNTASQVVIMQPDQQAALIFTIDAEAESVEEAAENFASQQGLQVEQSRPRTINSMPAYEVEASAQPQQSQQSIGLVSVFIEKSNIIFQFIGYTSTELYSEYQTTFDRSINGFNDLWDQNVLNVQPWRISLVTADHTGSLSDFAPQQTTTEFSIQSLIILNQIRSGNEVEQGRVLKIPMK